MKYRVIERFEFKTEQGIIKVEIGEVVTLSDDVGFVLLAQGKVVPVNPISFRIFSKKCDLYLWIVASPEVRSRMVKEGETSDPIFTMAEVDVMIAQDYSPDVIKKIVQVKKHFPDSEIL